MCLTEIPEMDNDLDAMWNEHREYLRRVLIGLSRDIDLVDDILQETYLRARAGLAGYRGGDARAWLAAVARNSLYMHYRSAGVRRSVPLDDDCAEASAAGSIPAETLLHLRQVIQGLDPSLRGALVMKHYGGFTYKEIAERLCCPVGTAKWRVSAALRQLRSALCAEEAVAMRCSESRLLDYLYGVLPNDEAGVVGGHLQECQACHAELEDVRRVVGALDRIEGDFKMMHIVELDWEGLPTVYCSISVINRGPDTSVMGFDCEQTFPVDYVIYNGEELAFESAPSAYSDHRDTYTVRLPRMVKHGERIDFVSISYHARHQPVATGHCAEFRDGVWLYLHQQCPGDEDEFVYMQVIRLPKKARLLGASPVPDEVNANGTTTLTWRALLAPDEQFECMIEYVCA